MDTLIHGFITRVSNSDKLQLAVVRTTHILANCNLRLKRRYVTKYNMEYLLNFKILSISLLFAFTVSAETELKGSPKELKNFLHPQVNTISISQSAEEVAFKDEAIISMLVTTEDDKLAESLGENAKIRSDISSALTASGIPLKNINNSKFSTSPDYSWFGDKPDSYKVGNTITVRISNEAGLQSVAKIVDKYDEVTLISTKYEHSKKDAYKQKVKEKALNKVLAQKEFYTKNLGVNLKVVSFNDQDTFVNDEMEMMVVTGSGIKKGYSSSVKAQKPVRTSFEKVIYSANITVIFVVE